MTDLRLLAVAGLLAVALSAVLWALLPPTPEPSPEDGGNWQPISAPDLAKRMETSLPPLLIDLRAALFYEEDHIPGAINLPIRQWSGEHLPAGLPSRRDRDIVLYCRDAFCRDSEKAAGYLLSVGYPNVRILSGGWAAWKQVMEDQKP
jgi:rhodanese-related sulfurtransferase